MEDRGYMIKKIFAFILVLSMILHNISVTTIVMAEEQEGNYIETFSEDNNDTVETVNESSDDNDLSDENAEYPSSDATGDNTDEGSESEDNIIDSDEDLKEDAEPDDDTDLNDGQKYSTSEPADFMKDIDANQVDILKNGMQTQAPFGLDTMENSDFVVRNQLILFSDAGFYIVEDLLKKYDGEIVGYISKGNVYQVEFTSENSKSLNILLEDIRTEPLISDVYFNDIFVLEDEEDALMSDSSLTPDFNLIPADEYPLDWGLKAINAQACWEYMNSQKNIDHINVGIIDKPFASSYSNFLKDLEALNYTTSPHYHSNHVAGIIGATPSSSGNNPGIINVPKTLYGISDSSNLEKFTSTFVYMFCISKLLNNNCKIINISMFLLNERKFSVTTITIFLNRILQNGYDFVIVNAAGNANEDAVDNGFAEYAKIVDTKLKNRIIVVGNVGISQITNNGTFVLEMAPSSNFGERVDIFAPGTQISSTVSDDEYMLDTGTSQSAPYVSGVAAMVWALNPSLTGEQVKSIIVNNTTYPDILDLNYKNATMGNKVIYHPFLDAEAAVKAAGSNGDNIGQKDKKNVVIGRVVDVDGNTLPFVKI